MTSIKWKRRFTYTITGLMFVLGGIEYAVILPTLWLYLEADFHTDQYILGLILSSYSLAAIVSAPLLGRWADKSRKPKVILILGAFLQAVGSAMYFMGISVWFLVASRLVAGFGAGAEAVIMAEVTRTSEETARTGIVSILVAVRQIGLLIGPGLNFFLREIDFTVDSFHVNKYNVPGAFMACIWAVQMVLILIFYTELHKLTPKTTKKRKTAQNYNSSLNDSIQYDSTPATRINYDEDIHKQIGANCSHSDKGSIRSRGSITSDADDLMATAEDLMSKGQGQIKIEGQDQNLNTHINLVHNSTVHGPNSVNASLGVNSIENGSVTMETDYEIYDGCLATPSDENRCLTDSQEYIESTEGVLDDYLAGKSKLKFIYHEYVREEIVTILAIQFNSFFNQMALETMVTPLSKKFLDFGELENSIVYSGGGAIVIATFILVTWLSKKLNDRTLMLIGCFVLTVAISWLIYILPNSKPHDRSGNLWRFAISIVLDLFALPFLAASSISLFSKITRKETQGLSMGIRRSVVGSAMVLAPLWSSSTLNQPYLMCGVMLAMTLISLVMMSVSFTKLLPLSELPVNRAGLITSTCSDENISETKPLLA